MAISMGRDTRTKQTDSVTVEPATQIGWGAVASGAIRDVEWILYELGATRLFFVVDELAYQSSGASVRSRRPIPA